MALTVSSSDNALCFPPNGKILRAQQLGTSTGISAYDLETPTNVYLLDVINVVGVNSITINSVNSGAQSCNIMPYAAGLKDYDLDWHTIIAGVQAGDCIDVSGMDFVVFRPTKYLNFNTTDVLANITLSVEFPL